MRALSLPVRILALLIIAAGPLAVQAQNDSGAHGNGTATIEGMVFAADGSLVPTATVFAIPVDSSAGDFVVSPVDPDGRYRLEMLSAGEYIVGVRSPEFASLYFKQAGSISDAMPVTVEDGALVTGIDFVLERWGGGTGSIEGRVVSSVDRSRIPRARVTAHAIGMPWPSATAVTGADGMFRLESLGAADWIVRVEAAGYIPEFYDDAATTRGATPIRVDEGAAVTGIAMALAPAGRISGLILDANGEPVEGAYLVAYLPGSMGGGRDSTGTDPGGIRDSTGVDPSGGPGPDGTWNEDGMGHIGRDMDRPGVAFSRPDGTYLIDGLSSGMYMVRADIRTPWRGVTVWFDGTFDPTLATPVPVREGRETTGIDFNVPVFGGYGVVSGRITSEGGDPREGVLVQMVPVIGDPACCFSFAYAYTRSDGSYVIPDVPAGEYRVQASAWDRWSSVLRWYPGVESFEGATVVTVAREERLGGIDFVLPRSGGSAVLSGHVVDTDGQALLGAQLMVQSWDGERDSAGRGPVTAWTSTDSTGAWSVDGIPAGTYVMYASWWDGDRFGQAWYESATHRADATPIVVTDGQILDGLEVVLAPQYLYGGISGVITDAATGLPVERAFVQFRPSSADMSFAPIRFPDAFAITDADGQYATKGLPIGTYLVSAHIDGGYAYFGGGWVPEQATRVEVFGGLLTDASFGVERRTDGNGAIEGSVAIDFTVDWADSMYSDATQPPRIAVVEARPTAMIQLWPESARFYTTVVRTDGTYTLSGLPEGEYFVSAYAPSFMPEFYDDTFDPGAATVVRVEAGQSTVGIDFLLVPSMFMDAGGGTRGNGATMHGRVTDENGNAVTDAIVYLMDADGKAVSSTTTTTDGTWVIPGVSRGYYRVMVTKEGFAATFNNDATRLDEAPMVENAGSGAEINVILRAAGSTATERPVESPSDFALRGNYPNPFNPLTTLVVDLPATADLSVEVFDLLGRRVLAFKPGQFAAGTASIPLDASDLPSGTYFYRVTARSGGVTSRGTGRMLLVK